MSLSNRLHKKVKRHLDPGEQFQAAWTAFTGPTPWLRLISEYFILFDKNYIFVATDRSIVVLKAGKFFPRSPRKVLQRHDRNVQFGPVKGLFMGKIDLDGKKYRVHKRTFSAINFADRSLGAPVPAGRF
jgi:hypothetical protein